MIPQYHWNWSILIEHPYLGWLMDGFAVTVALSLAAWVIAFSLGTLIAIMRTTSSRALRTVAAGYVQVFRNIPIVVQMFLWFFVLPEVVPHHVGYFLKRQMPYPEFVTGAVCLGFYTAARVAETMRAGIESIGPGKQNAALASGMTTIQTYRYVLLPLAYRLMLPPLISEFLTVFKNSSVALTIGVFELTMQAHQIESDTFQGFEAFTAATLLYALISTVCLSLANMVAARGRIGGMIGQAGDAR